MHRGLGALFLALSFTTIASGCLVDRTPGTTPTVLPLTEPEAILVQFFKNGTMSGGQPAAPGQSCGKTQGTDWDEYKWDLQPSNASNASTNVTSLLLTLTQKWDGVYATSWSFLVVGPQARVVGFTNQGSTGHGILSPPTRSSTWTPEPPIAWGTYTMTIRHCGGSGFTYGFTAQAELEAPKLVRG